jgi:hypothetical protein
MAITSAQDIQIKTRKEYLELPEEQQKKWVLYSPSSASEEYNELMSQTKALQQNLTDLEKLYEQMKNDPLMMKTQQVSIMAICITTLIDALTPILALVNEEIIGTLVKPLVEFLKALLKVLGLIFTLICTTIKQTWLNGKAVIDDLAAIDMSGIFVENTKKIFGGDHPSIEDSLNDVDWDMVAMKKEEVKALKANIKTQTKALEASDAYKEMVKKRSGELMAASIDALVETLMKPWKAVIGDDWKQLVGTDEKSLDKLLPNPFLASKSISGTLNKMAQHNYIQEKDMAAIKEYAMVREQKKQWLLDLEEAYKEDVATTEKLLKKGAITKAEYDSELKYLDNKHKQDLEFYNNTFDETAMKKYKQKMIDIFNMTQDEYEKTLINKQS